MKVAKNLIKTLIKNTEKYCPSQEEISTAIKVAVCIERVGEDVFSVKLNSEHGDPIVVLDTVVIKQGDTCILNDLHFITELILKFA